MARRGKIIKTDFNKELSKLGKFYQSIPDHVIRRAGRMAVNRGLLHLRTQATKAFKREVNLKSKEIKQDFFRSFKAGKGEMTSTLLVMNKKLSLIKFATSPRSKLPPNQKGIKVKSRKKIKVRVNPRRLRTLDHAFIARLQGGNHHITNRRTTKSLPIYKLGGIRPALLFSKRRFLIPLEKAASVRTRLVFRDRAQFYYRQHLRKVFAKNLKAT